MAGSRRDLVGQESYCATLAVSTLPFWSMEHFGRLQRIVRLGRVPGAGLYGGCRSPIRSERPVLAALDFGGGAAGLVVQLRSCRAEAGFSCASRAPVRCVVTGVRRFSSITGTLVSCPAADEAAVPRCLIPATVETGLA